MAPLQIILLAVGMFTAVILTLVIVLLIAKRQLVQSGNVEIEVNDDAERTFKTTAGRTLLETLAAQRIFVPSACGGKGSCGVCKVHVHEGGGAILPTELSHVTRGEAREGLRLACQVKVKRDLRITVPAEVFQVGKWQCKVRSNESVATFIKELVLELPPGQSVPFRAGGYVQVECPPHSLRYADFEIGERYRATWDELGLWELYSHCHKTLTRAYSMANYPGEEGIVMLNVRLATPPEDALHAPTGVMSSYIFNLKPGDDVTISGPFGEFFAKETDAEMCFVAGGAGMAPMRSHIYDQLLRLASKRKITFWYGARSLQEAFYVEEFDKLAREHDNFSWQLVLSQPRPEDDWEGPVGFAHLTLRDQFLKGHPAPEDVEYYLCGPPLMNKAVTRLLLEYGVERENIMFDDFS